MKTKKSNAKIKNQKVNYSSREKGKAKSNSRVDTNVVNRGRIIGKNMLKMKYEPIRRKQALANKMIRESHSYLKKDHDVYKEIREKKRTFYHSRGMKSKASLSYKDLRYGDLRAYENMLDSIINNPYLDREKYEELNRKNIQNIREGLLKDSDASLEQVQQVADIIESQIGQDLINMGLKYDVLDAYKEYSDDDMPLEMFFGMLNDFSKSVKLDYATLDDFLLYADEWKQHVHQFEEFVQEGKFNSDEWQLYKEEYMKVYSTGGVMLDI